MPLIPSDESGATAVRNAVNLTNEPKFRDYTQECPNAGRTIAKIAKHRYGSESRIE